MVASPELLPNLFGDIIADGRPEAGSALAQIEFGPGCNQANHCVIIVEEGLETKGVHNSYVRSDHAE